MSPSALPRTNRRPIALTDRDGEMLRSVVEYGVLSTEQLRAFFFPSASRARKRLRRLWQHGFLRRHVRPVRNHDGSAALLYTLGRTSNQYFIGQGVALPRLLSKRRASFGEHAVRITDFRVALSLALRHRDGLRLKSWHQGNAFRFQPSVMIGENAKFVPIVPDAYFTLDADGRDFNYFLEIDRGTTDLGRIKTKFLAYLNLWQSKAATAKLGILSFRILYVTTTEMRLANMVETLRNLQSSQMRLDLINLSCFSRYSLAQPTQLFDAIWQTIGSDGSGHRSQPFPTSPPLKLPIVPGNPPVSEPNARAR